MGAIARTSKTMAVESGKPNPGFGGARTLYGDLRDNYPETYQHLSEALASSAGTAGYKSKSQQIKEAKARIKARKGPETEEMKKEAEDKKKIDMLRHKCGVGGRRTPNGGFFT